jgi:hypothetical protein
MKKKHPDFVKWLESQLKAFRSRRFEKVDVEAVGCELEAVVGRYRSEVRRRAERLIPILMRPYHVYGDWDDLRFEWDVLLEAIKDSPSLAKRAAVDVRRAYRGARLSAELHGKDGWPKRCPWKTLEDLRAAVGAQHRRYLALERAGDADFGGLRRAPWKSAS